MSITDELREWWVRKFPIMDKELHKDFTAIADRIDAALAERYVELPKDADGEYIHIGDVMEWCDSGDTLEVVGIGADDTLFYFDKDSDGEEMADWTSARNKRHHHAPTVEDTLREMLDKWGELPSNMTNEAIVAEYAAKLQLRGDAE